MSVGLSIVAFVVGAIVSLATSWVLVSRLERVGERLGLSEALFGMVAALAADAPEGHRLHHGVSAPPAHRRRRGRPRVERLQSGRAPWARCGRGRQHQLAPESRGLLAARWPWRSVRRAFSVSEADFGWCGSRRRPRCSRSLCRSPGRGSKDPGASASPGEVDSVDHRRHRRGGERTRRGDPPPTGTPEMPGRLSVRWSSSSWPAWLWRGGRPHWAATSTFPDHHRRAVLAAVTSLPNGSLRSIWPGGAVARPR